VAAGARGDVIAGIDHLVLTVRNLDRTIAFYRDALGMKAVTFGEGRDALAFGDQKINLHVVGNEIVPHAKAATPGSADLCLLLDVDLEAAIERLSRHGIPIELGPVERTGARFGIRSVYVRDPDGNLIELAEPRSPRQAPVIPRLRSA